MWLAVIGVVAVTLVLVALGCIERQRDRQKPPPTATQPDQYDDWLDGASD